MKKRQWPFCIQSNLTWQSAILEWKSFTCYWSSSFSLIPLAPPLNAISFVFIQFSAQIWANNRWVPRTPPPTPTVWQILDLLLPPSMYFQTLCSLRLINPLIEFQPFLFIVYYFCRLSVSNAITHCFIFGCESNRCYCGSPSMLKYSRKTAIFMQLCEEY